MHEKRDATAEKDRILICIQHQLKLYHVYEGQFGAHSLDFDIICAYDHMVHLEDIDKIWNDWQSVSYARVHPGTASVPAEQLIFFITLLINVGVSYYTPSLRFYSSFVVCLSLTHARTHTHIQAPAFVVTEVKLW